MEKIEERLKGLNIPLSNEIRSKLEEEEINYESFILLNESDLSALGFKLGQRRTILNSFQQQANTTASTIQDENQRTTEYDSIKRELLKQIAPNINYLNFNRLRENRLDADFSTIITDKIDAESNENVDKIKTGFENRNFILTIKPYMLDALKRFYRLKSLKLSIIKVASDERPYLVYLEERDLICGLIESVQNPKSRAKLATLVMKNDYPLPLVYSKYDFRTNRIETQQCFELFEDVLCLTTRPLAVVSGTRNCVFKGKSSLIPHMFEGLHKELSVFRSTVETSFKKNNVDLICNQENGNELVIADFHSHVESNEAKNMLKSFGAYASLHVINVTMDDFGNDGKFSDELKELLDWYRDLYQNNRLGQTPTYIVLLVRDYKFSDETKKNSIKKNMINHYIPKWIDLLTIEKFSENDVFEIKLNDLRKNIKAIISTLKEKTKTLKPFHSIYDIKRFLTELNKDPAYKTNSIITTRIEQEFEQVFNFTCDDLESIKRIFPITLHNASLHKIDEELKMFQNDAKKCADLKQQQFELDEKPLNVFNKFKRFFIDIVLGDQFMSDLVLFESCLLEFKKEKLKSLRNERQTIQDSYVKLDQALKEKQIKLEEKDQSDQIDDKDDLKAEAEALLRSKEKLKQDINSLDDKIEILDLTVDKFWDELFLTYDWIINKESNRGPILDESLKSEIENFKSSLNVLTDHYIELVEYGYSIHILRGRPLKLESNMLKMIFDKMSKPNQELYVITVIGEQSSAKSSLMNALFGCDFRTSAGRCTVGIYMNFVTYGSKRIVILDTEGLMSVESGNVVLDNQFATMAVLSSHLIIINHKGEISTNLEKLLGITFYAKMQISSSKFKPSLNFILRDQTNRQESSVRIQASKLKGRLVDQASELKLALDDIMTIETDDVILLPNAFAEHGGVKWRNDMFPNLVLDLRVKFIEKLRDMDKSGHSFNELIDLYESMRSYWSTLADLGDGILNCRDIFEIKIRKQAATLCSSIVAKYLDNFIKSCSTIVDEGKNEMKAKKRKNEEVNKSVNDELEKCHGEESRKIKDEFREKARSFSFPLDIETEYQDQIENNLKRILNNYLSIWDSYYTDVRTKSKIEEDKQYLVEIVSQMITRGEDSSSPTFVNSMRTKIDDINSKFEEYLKNSYESNEQYALKIEQIYNTNHIRYAFDSMLSNFDLVGQINDLKKHFNRCERDYTLALDDKKWFKAHEAAKTVSKNKPPKTTEEGVVKKGFIEKNLNKMKKVVKNVTTKFIIMTNNEFDEEDIVEWIKDTLFDVIVPEVLEKIDKPLVEEPHIRNSIEIINNHFFTNPNSPVARYSCYFQLNAFILDVLKFVFYEMWKRYIELRDYEKSKLRSNHEKMIKDLNDYIATSREFMKNSREMGKRTAENVLKNLRANLFASFVEKTNNETTKDINEILKSPKDIVDKAFNRSFKAYNYEAVYKYVRDVVKYCNEVCQSDTDEKIKGTIRIQRAKFNEEFGNFFSNSLSFAEVFKFKPKMCEDKFTIYKIIEELISYLTNKKQNELAKNLEQVKKSIINGNIDNLDHFIDSFSKEIKDEYEIFKEKITNEDSELEKAAKENLKKIIKKVIGCEARCPGCGSKCNLDCDHKGSHHSEYHIYNGFSGWKDKNTSKARTQLCWENNFYKNCIVLIGAEDKYNGLEDYLQQKHTNWVEDVKEKHVKFGQACMTDAKSNLKIKAFDEFEWLMKKVWINTRKPIIECYKNLDLDYDEDWKKLEDVEKSLKKDFTIDGY